MQCYHLIQLKSGVLVPCGKCPACKANYRQEWIFRLKEEYKSSLFSIFVTLTYNDENLPEDLSVNKRDVQLFHKRLRKHFLPGELRFYLVSEYGDTGKRPHYHGLYFFRSEYKKSFIYDVFEESWNKGFIKFGDVEEGSIVYCTKYCLKGSDVPEGRKPCFRLVSKMNGGIGSSYLEKMSQYHLDNQQFDFVSSDGKRCRMPRYYRSKLVAPDWTRHFVRVTDRAYETEKRMYERIQQDFIKRFKLFLQNHKGLPFDEAQRLFNIQEKQRGDVRDELIIKHCKKQKL